MAKTSQQGEIVYSENATKVLEGGISTANTYGLSFVPKSRKSAGDMLSNADIAQSHFFTVQIYSAPTSTYNHPTGLHERNGKPISFASGKGTYSDYLPVKTMQLNYTSYDHLTIPFTIFGDLPIPHRKRVSTVSFSCYDMDNDVIERALKYWEDQCFVGNCVEYLDNIKATLKYRSYSVTGKLNFTKYLDVIPAGTTSVSRSYAENGEKLLNFSVVVVGTTGASAKSGSLSIKERGYGDGNETADLTYTKDTAAAITNYNYNY